MSKIDELLDNLLRTLIICAVGLALIAVITKLDSITAKLDRIEQKQCAEVKDESK
jgi:hypothetical protein